MSSKILLSLAAAAAVLTTGTGTASAATAPELDITGANLLAKGAAVRVNLSVLCDDVNSDPSYPDVSLTVSVRQAQKGQVVEGTAYGQLRCDGERQTPSLVVTAYSAAFKKAPAFVRAELTEYWTFESVSDDAEVRLK